MAKAESPRVVANQVQTLRPSPPRPQTQQRPQRRLSPLQRLQPPLRLPLPPAPRLRR